MTITGNIPSMKELELKTRITNRHGCYLDGWKLGASGMSILGAVGTPAPEYEGDFKRGHADGLKAYNEAMSANFKRTSAEEGK